jgi:hypothetical protein
MKQKISLLQILPLVSIVISVFFTQGCTSSRLSNEWRDPAFASPPLKHILVVAPRKNPINKRLWEDVLVSGLAAEGVDATPAYRLFGDSIPSPDDIGAAVKEKSFDGVLMVKRLPTQISTFYVPGTAKEETVQRFNRFTQSYETVFRDVQQPGYTDSDRVVRNQVDVFSSAGGNGILMWSGTGEIIDPSSRDAVKNEVADLIIPELAAQGIIPKR